MRSLLSRYGKWITLIVVVAALALWFYLSSGVENYADKYAGADLTTGVAGIGRDNTYELYLLSHQDAPDASFDVPVDVTSVQVAEGVEVRDEGVYTAGGSEATWIVTVPESGFYNISLT